MQRNVPAPTGATGDDPEGQWRRTVAQTAAKLVLEPIFEADMELLLLKKVARRVQDDAVMHLLKMMLDATGKKGVPQGGVISPLLSNVYLTEVDQMPEKAIETTRNGKEKSRIVDLAKGGSFAFPGFEFRRILSRKGVWRPHYTPKLKKRTALLGKLREMFRRYASQPVGRVIELINPILRGWVNEFAVGHSSRCFWFVKDWVEKKIRRHLTRARALPRLYLSRENTLFT